MSARCACPTSRSAASIAAAAAAITFAGSSAYATSIDCAWYARTAVQQQQENLRRKCNFSGATWSDDARSHLAWCAKVAPAAFIAEARTRSHKLANECKK